MYINLTKGEEKSITIITSMPNDMRKKIVQYII